jgi:hypothetical protein
MKTTSRVTIPSAAQLYALERAAQRERAQLMAQYVRAAAAGLKRLALGLARSKPAKARATRAREVSHA